MGGKKKKEKRAEIEDEFHIIKAIKEAKNLQRTMNKEDNEKFQNFEISKIKINGKGGKRNKQGGEYKETFRKRRGVGREENG